MNGPALPALAVLAGVLSFSSPCILPLVPAYISYMSGVSAGRGRALAATGLFVLGFAAVFTALGAAASALGQLLGEHRRPLEVGAGVVMIALGLILFGLIRPGPMEREGRPLLGRVSPGPTGALFLGVAFGFGWTPCVGPVLGSILILAGSSQTLAGGTILLFLYSLGLGVPFLLAALLLDRFQPLSLWLRRRAAIVNGIGGALLVGLGVLLAAGRLQQTLAPGLELYARLRWPPI